MPPVDRSSASGDCPACAARGSERSIPSRSRPDCDEGIKGAHFRLHAGSFSEMPHLIKINSINANKVRKEISFLLLISLFVGKDHLG